MYSFFSTDLTTQVDILSSQRSVLHRASSISDMFHIRQNLSQSTYGYSSCRQSRLPQCLDIIHIFKGCQVWGWSRTSIPTSYLKYAGLNTPGVKFSSYSVQPLPRYYGIQTGSKVGTANHNLGNPSHLMT